MTVRKRGGTVDYGATGEWSGGEARGNLLGFVVGQGRLGIDRIADLRDMVPPTPKQPVSSTDFLYAKSEDFLNGSAGKWKTFFPPSRSSEAQADTVDRVRRALEHAGLSEQVEKLDVGIGKWGLLRSPHVTLEMKPGVELSAAQIHAALAAAWPVAGPPLPGVTVTFDVFSDHGATSDKLLSTLITEHEDGRITFGAKLDVEQHTRLTQWVKATGHPTGANDLRRLAALMRADTSLSTASGQASLSALGDLGLLPRVIGEGIQILRQTFGDDALAGKRTFYNGHATLAMTALLPSLRAFGAGECNLWVSNASGTTPARELLRLQAPDFFRSDSSEDKLKVTDCIYDLLLAKGGPLIVDKGRNVLQILRPEMPHVPYVADGRLRFVVHNRDDGLSPLMQQKGWAVDLANSLVKKLEARFIGEQYALIGAREAREKLGQRIGDTPTVVVGFGLLGEQLARALVRAGKDPSQITIEDTDPAARARAARLGFSVALPAQRPKTAVVYVATAATAIDEKNAGKYADTAVVIALTSGGKGVRLPKGGEPGRAHPTAGGVMFDRAIPIPSSGDHADCLLHLISEGHPPNLADPMWNDRFALTSLAVTAAMVQAGKLERPGIERLRPDVDLALVRLAKRLGLWERRPLEARAGEDPAQLAQDLQAFRATTSAGPC